MWYSMLKNSKKEHNERTWLSTPHPRSSKSNFSYLSVRTWKWAQPSSRYYPDLWTCPISRELGRSPANQDDLSSAETSTFGITWGSISIQVMPYDFIEMGLVSSLMHRWWLDTWWHQNINNLIGGTFLFGQHQSFFYKLLSNFTI